MDEKRWPKICLREEIRGIMNRHPLKWGKELNEAMEKAGDGRIIEHIWKRGESKNLEEWLKEGPEMMMEQDIQGDWEKIDKSSFCPLYKQIKASPEREEYWNIKSDEEWLNGTWARLRCGNVRRWRQ